jgi:potassium-transporting ATPase potassium-binding subunit
LAGLPSTSAKRSGPLKIKFASLYFLATPVLVLSGNAAALATGNSSTALNVGPHGFSEVLYAFTSASNNNGSAFAGITVNTTWWNTALGLAMLLGRFVPIVLVLGLAGSLGRQQPVPAGAGSLPTHRPLFVGMVVGVLVILVALTFLPALSLGPLAEGL